MKRHLEQAAIDADKVAENQYREMIFSTVSSTAHAKMQLALVAIACELRAARVAERGIQ